MDQLIFIWRSFLSQHLAPNIQKLSHECITQNCNVRKQEGNPRPSRLRVVYCPYIALHKLTLATSPAPHLANTKPSLPCTSPTIPSAHPLLLRRILFWDFLAEPKFYCTGIRANLKREHVCKLKKRNSNQNTFRFLIIYISIH